MEKVQTGGVRVGKEKFWTLGYADDVVMIAEKEEDMREMLRRLRTYLGRKKLELNVEKSKIMVFSKGRGKKRKTEWKWKGKEIETVKEFKYLGVKLQKNGDIAGHVRERAKAANMAVGQVWGIGERLFRDDWKKRMLLFDCLIMGIMMYGVEIFGWREREELERVQTKYIKWCLKLDRTTPDYIVLEETKREKLRVKAGARALGYEERVEGAEGRCLVKECLRERKKGGCSTRNSRERTEYLNRNGFSQLGLELEKGEGKDIMRILKERDRENQGQWQWNRIREARYNKLYKHIYRVNLPKYLEERGERGSQSLMARARCGNMEEGNRYWMKEEDRRCKLCERDIGSLKHLAEDCTGVERINIGVEKILQERRVEEVVEWLRGIEGRRKEKIRRERE